MDSDVILGRMHPHNLQRCVFRGHPYKGYPGLGGVQDLIKGSDIMKAEHFAWHVVVFLKKGTPI